MDIGLIHLFKEMIYECRNLQIGMEHFGGEYYPTIFILFGTLNIYMVEIGVGKKLQRDLKEKIWKE